MNYDQLTISAWFYRDAKDTVNADAIWGGWDWNSNVQLQQGYDLRFAPNSDAIEFDLVTQTSGGVKTCNVCYAGLGNSLGQWFYVAATYDAATGAQTIYVNGAAVQTVSQPAGNTVVPLTGYNNMYIGYSNTNSGYFDGRIDDVKVFDRPLTAEEIARNIKTAT